MKSQSNVILLCIATLLLLSGCILQQPTNTKSSSSNTTNANNKLYQERAEQARLYYENEQNKPSETMVITARGWGAPPKQYYPEGNRRLMAMRAAKLDAFRSLAERIHGVRIWGGTTVGEMVLEKDQFKVLLDAYVVGAKVLNIMEQKDGNYEAVVEIEVDRNFLYRALASRSGLLNVPPEYSSLPKTPYEQNEIDLFQAESTSNSGAAEEESAMEPNSHANFYFSD